MVLFVLIVLISVAADQFTKLWVLNTLKPTLAYMDVWPGVFGFTYAENTGAAFSLFSDMRWVLTVFSALVALAITVYVVWKKPNRLGTVSLALIAGGAVGNIIDRVRFGFVVDFVNLEFMQFAVFNVADACINVGAAMMLLWAVLDEVRQYRQKKAEDAAKAAAQGEADAADETPAEAAEEAAEEAAAEAPAEEVTQND